MKTLLRNTTYFELIFIIYAKIDKTNRRKGWLGEVCYLMALEFVLYLFYIKRHVVRIDVIKSKCIVQFDVFKGARFCVNETICATRIWQTAKVASC